MLDGVLHYGCDNNANNRQTASNSYYSAHNKLMAVQKWTDQSRTWEEYWYDALGRRVFTRTRHDQPTCGPPVVCPGFVDRTVWDGDQIIAEQRSSGLDVVTGGAPNFGTVRYVHLLGIDAPVAILDNRFADARVIHYNWRGLAEASSWSNGNPADEELGAGIKVAWPAGQGVYLQRGNNPNVGQDVTWIGSLPANGQGDAGLVYRRNRFFDPASGRFTQEDPIGLAGGLNLYGFAEGDPVNFSDPFGLCTGSGGAQVPAKKCRDVTFNEGRKIFHEAATSGKWTYTLGRTEQGEPAKDVPNKVGDCTDFCDVAQDRANLPPLDPTVRTRDFATSSDYRALGSNESPQIGDIIVQGRHAGILSGTKDRRGRLMGLQNGKSGTKMIPWGRGVRGLDDVDPIIYRRQVPK